MKKIEKTIHIGERDLTLSTGYFAQQATFAVMAKYGETVVLATVVAALLKEDWGYFPLSVEYQERLYAGGRIKGSRWVKREGRPSDEEILTGRLIDRFIRPLFFKEYQKEVQVMVMVLSVDLENTPDIISAIAVSAALASSNIPWSGPAGVVRVGKIGEKFITNPIQTQLEESEIDLVGSYTKDAIVMIEAGAKEVPEKTLLGAIAYGEKEAHKIIDFINDFASLTEIEKERLEKTKRDSSLEKKVKELTAGNIAKLLTKLSTKEAGYAELDELKNALIKNFSDEEKKQSASLFDELLTKEFRKMVLSGKRPDGRKLDEIRKLSAEVEVLPRTHGSALFQRGQTQVLTVTTLGSPSLEQLIESAEGEESKRYIHHYSMPPYSTGETGRVGYPSRREIGHGALAERALLPVIPSEEKFPYTIRIVSEVLSSNGSTSMAATCGSTLSLMDAGVPIKSPIAGISMGLVVEDSKNYVVLTDITGIEDGNGDMDFKVAGSKEGITALQLDVKTLNLTPPILEKAIEEAKKARLQILSVMLKVLPESRSKVSTHAPKIKVLKVPQDKIGEVIGPGGRMIRAIIAETGAQVDIEDDGTINVSGLTDEEVEKAVKKIEGLTKEVMPGEIYEGEVKRIESFGAFVEILPNRDGLVHISDMSEGFVKNPADLVRIGDRIKVRVKEIDDLGRVNLSMLLEGDKKKPAYSPDRKGRRFEGRRKEFSSGPHFPASRFFDIKKKSFSK